MEAEMGLRLSRMDRLLQTAVKPIEMEQSPKPHVGRSWVVGLAGRMPSSMAFWALSGQVSLSRQVKR